ncbi:MAG TPA: type II toxin-antitoxin system HicB family antitoxin [Nitrospiria bacterium]|jgi:predicted RNase H-like HicB family nuclease
MALYRYTVDILPEENGKGYYASVPALPGCFSQGKTIEETKKNIQAAIKLHIKSFKESERADPN